MENLLQEESENLKLVQKSIRLTEEEADRVNAWPDDGFSGGLDEIFKTCFADVKLLRKGLEDVKKIRDRLLKQIRLMKLVRDSIASSLDRLESIIEDAADNCKCIQEEYALTGRDRRDSECRS